MNISRLSLNLLHAFNALFEEGQVTRAAARLHITQAALSNNLKQLRELFSDELFIRTKTGVMPTSKAQLLAPQIKLVLTQLHALANFSCGFKPELSTRTFVIAMSDYSEHALLPHLMKALSKVAPHISIQLRHLNMLNNEADLERARYDLVLGFASIELKHCYREALLVTAGMCIGSKKYGVLQRKPTLKQYLAARHIVLSYYDEANPLAGNSERVLREMGYHRDIALTVPHVLPVLNMVYETPYIGTVPVLLGAAHQPKTISARIKELRQQYPDRLNYQELPFEIPRVNIEMIWHRITQEDPGLMWLRNLVTKVASELT